MPFDTDESITFAEFAQLYKCIIATMQMLSICPSKEGRERLRGRVGGERMFAACIPFPPPRFYCIRLSLTPPPILNPNSFASHG